MSAATVPPFVVPTFPGHPGVERELLSPSERLAASQLRERIVRLLRHVELPRAPLGNRPWFDATHTLWRVAGENGAVHGLASVVLEEAIDAETPPRCALVDPWDNRFHLVCGGGATPQQFFGPGPIPPGARFSRRERPYDALTLLLIERVAEGRVRGLSECVPRDR